MAKAIGSTTIMDTLKTNKGTSQGHRNVKMSSMNKGKKRGWKKYRGQGK